MEEEKVIFHIHSIRLQHTYGVEITAEKKTPQI